MAHISVEITASCDISLVVVFILLLSRRSSGSVHFGSEVLFPSKYILRRFIYTVTHIYVLYW